MSKIPTIILAIITLTLIFAVGVYFRIVGENEIIEDSWTEVVSQYQRRADLVPNLVGTLKSFTDQEKDMLTNVVETRAKVTSMLISTDTLSHPERFKRYLLAQNQLSNALNQLSVRMERYPDIKLDKTFLKLQSTLQETEDEIKLKRKRYVRLVNNYNLMLSKFPGDIIARFKGFKSKPVF